MGQSLSDAKSREPNVYRDGDLLVVPWQEEASFPSRCVKTNTPVDAANFRLRITGLKVDEPSLGTSALKGAATAALGAAGSPLVDALVLRGLTLHIGLSSKQQSHIFWGQVRAVFLGLGGFAFGCVVAWLGSILSRSLGVRMNFDAWMIGIVLGAVPFFIILGLVIWKTPKYLCMERIFGPHVWFSGAGAEFLASLPESPVHWEKPKGIQFGRN